MAILVKNPGFYSILQDQGRQDYVHLGISPSTPMDFDLFLLANKLVSNLETSPCIEFLMKGPTLLSTGNHTISVVGDISYVSVNGFKYGSNRTIHIKKGDLIDVGPFTSGIRGYIGIHGITCNHEFLGSVTYEDKTKKGVKLIKGLTIECGYQSKVCLLAKMKRNKRAIRLLKGPDYNRFTKEGIQTLINTKYKITNASNRMGIRLSGHSIEHLTTADILSRPLVKGAMQVPLNGQPIIMMSDHQPTGGYTIIGTVVAEDLWLLSQGRVDEELAFRFVEVDEIDHLDQIEIKAVKQKRYKMSINDNAYDVEVAYEDQL